MREPDAHETWRVAAENLHWIALGLVGGLVLVVAGMYWFAQPLLQRARDLPTPEAPPAPRLQPSPLADLAAERAREESALAGYGRVDAKQGIARIPIERAMAILAERAGHAQREGSTAPATHSPARDAAGRDHPAVDQSPQCPASTPPPEREP
jgi:hypothetical protein